MGEERSTCATLSVLVAVLVIAATAGSCATSTSPPSVTREELRAELPDPLAAGWRGQPACERLHEDGRHRILRCSFPPGSGHERHFHGPHFGYALAGGRMRITDERGGREVELATGSSFHSQGVAWHEVLNVGETTVVYLLVEPK